MAKKRKIAIITGVTSFLGRSTAKYLLSKNFLVFGIVRPDSEKISELDSIEGLNIIKLDFNDLSSNEFDNISNSETFEHIKVIKESRNDISVIHFAWGSTLDRNNFAKQMLNVDMSIKVLHFAKMINASRFIFAGSQAEESDSAYGLAKKQFADYAIKETKFLDMRFIHMRIFSIYGKEDRETSLIKTLVKNCKENVDMSLSSCNYMWNFLYIDDFVSIIYKLIDKDAHTGVYDIASDDTRLLKDYVIEAHETLGAKSNLNFGERQDSAEKFAIPDISDTLNAIGKFKFTAFRDGILGV